MIRFYFLRIIQIGSGRGPKYIQWRDNPSGIPVSLWGLMDYGFEPVCIFRGDVTAEQHTELSGYPDVYAFPEDLSAQIGANLATMESVLEAINLPSAWLTPTTTYRQILKRSAIVFQCLQRLKGMIGNFGLFNNGGKYGNKTLNNTLAEIRPAVRYALMSAAGQIDIEDLTEALTIRQFLIRYAQAWTDPIIIGGEEL